MYTSAFFRESREEPISELLRDNIFATLVTHSERGYHATHLPLLYDPEPRPHGTLVGHMARGNSQWRDLADGDEVLAIFLGPHVYVSPRYYVAEADVPTWNYTTVHVRGTWRLEPDPCRTRQMLELLVQRCEAAFPAPWSLEYLRPELLASLQRGIVAFEIEVTRIDCAAKLSQDKQSADREAVIAGLECESGPGARLVAAAMRRLYGC